MFAYLDAFHPRQGPGGRDEGPLPARWSGDMRCKQVLNDCLQTLLAPMREAARGSHRRQAPAAAPGCSRAPNRPRPSPTRVLAEVKGDGAGLLLRIGVICPCGAGWPSASAP